MAKISKKAFEELYTALGPSLRAEEAREPVRRALESLNPHLCRRAGRAIGEFRLTGLEAQIVSAYNSLFRGDDPGCLGKIALAEALDMIDYDEADPFLRGVVYRSRAGASTTNDSGAGLRVRCGLALVRMRRPDVLVFMADLLADPAPLVRAGAANALAYHGDEAGAALLRLKLNQGDPETEVQLEVLKAYIALDNERGLEKAKAMLRSGEGSSEDVIMAIGESRLDAAFPILKACTETAITDRMTRLCVLALLTLRTSKSLDYIRELAASDNEMQAAIAKQLLEEVIGC